MMLVSKRKALIYLPWLALPLVLAAQLVLWGSLPAKMAVHFDYTGTADRWMSKGETLALNALVMTLVLTTLTDRLTRKYGQDPSTADMLRHYFWVGLLTAILLGMLIYNV